MKLTALVILSAIAYNLQSQIDTLPLRLEVLALEAQSDHVRFWDQVYHDDQTYRGKDANDSIDITNLIKCCYYLNKFGFPVKEHLGSKSQIIQLVWIHNRLPQTDLLTFPMIMEGYSAGQIREEDLKHYYLKSIYKNRYTDKEFSQISISELLRQADLQLKKPIDISKVVEQIQFESRLLNEPNENIGTWYAAEVMDTTYMNGEPIIHSHTKSPLNIFMTDEGVYYFQRLHDDRSHYPQMLIRSGNTFKLDNGTDAFLEILPDGNLREVDIHGNPAIYTRKAGGF